MAGKWKYGLSSVSNRNNNIPDSGPVTRVPGNFDSGAFHKQDGKATFSGHKALNYDPRKISSRDLDPEGTAEMMEEHSEDIEREASPGNYSGLGFGGEADYSGLGFGGEADYSGLGLTGDNSFGSGENPPTSQSLNIRGTANIGDQTAEALGLRGVRQQARNKLSGNSSQNTGGNFQGGPSPEQFKQLISQINYMRSNRGDQNKQAEEAVEKLAEKIKGV